MNIFQSIWNYKCPRCRRGDLFNKPFKMSNPLDMHKSCEQCKLSFEPEPGYYFGAMFISYIWTGFTCLIIVGTTIIFLDWSIEAAFGFLILIAALSYFWVMRISRSMYIHLDIRYDENQKIAEK